MGGGGGEIVKAFLTLIFMDLFTVINVDCPVGSLCVYWSVGGHKGLREGGFVHSYECGRSCWESVCVLECGWAQGTERGWICSQL